MKKIFNKGSKGCLNCIDVFLENEITDDSFIEYKSQYSDILSPCKSTIEIMNTIDNILNKYGSQHVSSNSMVSHIMRHIDKDKFYDKSSCSQTRIYRTYCKRLHGNQIH